MVKFLQNLNLKAMSFKNANQAIQRFIAQDYRTVPVPLLNALQQARAANTSIREEPSIISGKLRQLKISYYPIVCDAANDTCDNTNCGEGDPQAPIQEYFDVTRCIESKKQQLSIEDVRDVDNNWNFSQHAMEQMKAMLGSMRRELGLRTAGLIVANAGLHLDGNAEKRITPINTTTGVINPVGLWQVEKEFYDGAFTNPFIIGGTDVFQWKKALGIATENTFTGQDYRKLGDRQMYYDTLIDVAAGDVANGGNIIAFDPNALKFQTFNKNVGIFNTTEITDLSDLDRMYQRGGTDYARGLLVDPITGIAWDLNIDFDKCTDTFTWFIRLYWDIYFPRIQACNIEGVNGIFLYRTCPEVGVICPTGPSPVSPIAVRTFSWTPTAGGVTYPDFIYQSTIAGKENYPNVNVANVAEMAATLNEAYGVNSMFRVSGANVVYDGYSAITGTLNNGAITVTFA